MKNNQLVTLAEQEEMGLRRPSAPINYVPPSRNPQPLQVLPAQQSTAYTLDVPHTATLHTELRTSAVDRAKGYLIETTTLTFVFALALVLAVRYWNDWPLLGAGMYLSTLLLFSVLWGGSYVVHKFLSAEGVAFYEASRKWSLLEAERRDRAAYYRRLANLGDGD